MPTTSTNKLDPKTLVYRKIAQWTQKAIENTHTPVDAEVRCYQATNFTYLGFVLTDTLILCGQLKTWQLSKRAVTTLISLRGPKLPVNLWAFSGNPRLVTNARGGRGRSPASRGFRWPFKSPRGHRFWDGPQRVAHEKSRQALFCSSKLAEACILKTKTQTDEAQANARQSANAAKPRQDPSDGHGTKDARGGLPRRGTGTRPGTRPRGSPPSAKRSRLSLLTSQRRWGTRGAKRAQRSGPAARRRPATDANAGKQKNKKRAAEAHKDLHLKPDRQA